MNKEVLVTLKGTQDIEGETESVELVTFGKYYRRNNHYYITYKETEDDGCETRTMLVVEGSERVTMTRYGGNASQLVFEKGVHHLGHYNTMYGDLMVGVCARDIESTLTDAGGALSVNYSVNINHTHTSDNRIDIEVKEAKVPDLRN